MVVALILTLGMVGCAQQESKQTVKQPPSELITYIAKEKPISERHLETLQVISKAIKAISLEAEKPSLDNPSKTQIEAIELPKPSPPTSIQTLTVEALVRSLTGPKTPPELIIPSGLKEALTSGIDTLDWALEQMDSEIRDYQRLNPPPEAKTYHGLTVEVLLKEQAIYSNIRSNYISLLSNWPAPQKGVQY